MMDFETSIDGKNWRNLFQVRFSRQGIESWFCEWVGMEKGFLFLSAYWVLLRGHCLLKVFMRQNLGQALLTCPWFSMCGTKVELYHLKTKTYVCRTVQILKVESRILTAGDDKAQVPWWPWKQAYQPQPKLLSAPAPHPLFLHKSDWKWPPHPRVVTWALAVLSERMPSLGKCAPSLRTQVLTHAKVWCTLSSRGTR